MRKFLLMALHTLFMFSAHTAESDKEALLEFKSQLSRGSRAALASWNGGSLHLCNWTGVTCGRKHQRVTQLRLISMKLAGVISPSVGNLSFLRSLDLGGNSFHGNIPQEVGKLSRLRYLNMSSNLLGGGIPVGLSNCSSLLRLDLSFNRLAYKVPSELGLLSKLIVLNLSKNQLMGKLPPGLGNLTSLEKLSIAFNHMEGDEIPENIAKLNRMVFVQLAGNKLSGAFPNAFRNLSSLEFISIASNNFSGDVGLDFGTLFPDLQFLSVGGNDFTGTLLVPFSNISTLRQLELSYNNFRGSIPLSLSRNQRLVWLGLSQNGVGNNASADLDFLGGLTNCTQLQVLDVGYNILGGALPVSIGNLSKQMAFLYFGGNYISGSIPLGVGNLVNLQGLGFERNRLTGKLPTSLGKLSGLVKITGQSNRFSGELPSFLGNMTTLESIFLFKNEFEGRIPPNLVNCSFLQHLGLYSNHLTGTIPRELMDLPSLVVLDVSYNSLVGPLPENVGNLKYLMILQAFYNRLSGQIPQTLGNCLSMDEIILRGNSFNGTIPYIGRLKGLHYLDLSNNSLSGNIPGFLVNLPLQYLNLSMNNFEGAVPMTGAFRNASVISVFRNKNLCGGIPELQLKPCSMQMPATRRRQSVSHKKVAIFVSLGITLLLLSFLTVISLSWFKKWRKQNRANNGNSQPNSAMDIFYERISYEELQNSTDGFSSTNIIGSGYFSTVFKGFLGPERKVVAVKVLNLWKSGAVKSFMAECEALKGIRHRNLVKLLTVCSSIDFNGNEFRALVYEFMPNGNLDTWLHPQEVEAGTSNPTRTLNLLERLNITIDVASVLVHLHCYCHSSITHCDLKPSNVLLDDDLTAHVSDFGLARLLGKFDQEASQNQFSSANIRGTIGYMPPEYGMGGEPSVMGDVYSFGVLVLEMFTGKRPTDELFSEDFTIHNHTRSSLPARVTDIVDPSILYNAGARMERAAMAECLGMVLDVGIRCSEESPANRTAIVEAVEELVSIRKRFFKAKRTTMQR
ncbi:PREDICTED: putative receptor-like protein kinase At3g47110 [Tarenaya hassleriana]|uniref:putative receptor-like protein kinase At3g47110 n=1 Tax=Tarenaya hassleriana TaxID=28532 RepID=UPI00053C9EF2|nr:PREDICTED: putative receptor-like protein kinase At3g47110 [Tarenaya hassleriana]